MNQEINTKIAVLSWEETMQGSTAVTKLVRSRLRHYKAAAAYAVAITKNPRSYKVTTKGIRWVENIELFDDVVYPIAVTYNYVNYGNLKYGWDRVIESLPEYAAMRYVMTAIANAQAEVRKEHGF